MEESIDALGLSKRALNEIKEKLEERHGKSTP